MFNIFRTKFADELRSDNEESPGKNHLVCTMQRPTAAYHSGCPIGRDGDKLTQGQLEFVSKLRKSLKNIFASSMWQNGE
jgi:hypothetical protein